MLSAESFSELLCALYWKWGWWRCWMRSKLKQNSKKLAVKLSSVVALNNFKAQCFCFSSAWPSTTVTTWARIPTCPTRAGRWTEGSLSSVTSRYTWHSPPQRCPACCGQTSPDWASSTGRSGTRSGGGTLAPRENTGSCPSCWWNSRVPICREGPPWRRRGRSLRKALRSTWRGRCRRRSESGRVATGAFTAFQSASISRGQQVGARSSRQGPKETDLSPLDTASPLLSHYSVVLMQCNFTV